MHLSMNIQVRYEHHKRPTETREKDETYMVRTYVEYRSFRCKIIL